MKDANPNPEKIEESATCSQVHAPTPTPGQVEKARAFCRAWPVADRAFPDFTRDPSPSTDAPIALAQLLADEVTAHRHALENAQGEFRAAADDFDMLRASRREARDEADSLRELVRAACGALSDVVQLVGRPDVRALLDAYAGPEPSFVAWRGGHGHSDARAGGATFASSEAASYSPTAKRPTHEGWTAEEVAREVAPWPAPSPSSPSCEHPTDRTWSIASGHADWCSLCGALRVRSPGSLVAPPGRASLWSWRQPDSQVSR